MEANWFMFNCLFFLFYSFTDAKSLVSVDMVERLREKVYAALDEYCRRQHPKEPGRFAKLLLRLPALRSIGLKSIEHLFFYKLVNDSQMDSFLIEMLDIPTSSPSSSTLAWPPATELVWTLLSLFTDIIWPKRNYLCPQACLTIEQLFYPDIISNHWDCVSTEFKTSLSDRYATI